MYHEVTTPQLQLTAPTHPLHGQMSSSAANRRSKTPPRPVASSSAGDDEDGATILRGKVEKLLVPYEASKANEPSSSFFDAYGAERNVVALVLLTRLEAPHAAQVMLRHPEMIQFCRRLATLSPRGRPKMKDPPGTTTGSPSTTASALYSRLVAQAVASCFSDFGTESEEEKVLSEVGSLLLKLLEKSAGTTGPFAALDVDLVAALAAFLPCCHDSTTIDSMLLALWRRAATVLDQDSSATNDQRSNSLSGDEQKRGVGKDEPGTPDELLEATLGSILDQNSAWAIESDEQFCGNFEWYEIQVGRIFLDHGCRLSCTVQRPSFVVPMLEWWLRRSKEQRKSDYSEISSDYSELASPSPWPHILLQCIQQNTDGFRDVGTDPKLASDVLKLVLACVVNVTADDNLRGQAWFSLSSLVSAVGWDWMLMTGGGSQSPGSALGGATKLCAILRMASGEYKIQLNHRLYGSAATASAERRADRDSLAEECCRFLALSMEYVATLAERADDENDSEEVKQDRKPSADPAQPTLSNAAILHIRKSLHEALVCSAHYCIERTSFSTECDLCVVRLLGALLSEFDIFLESRQAADVDDEHAILNALRTVLNLVRDRGACESLLPGLLMIFASSEGDKDRAAVLKPYLADVVGFFEFWWASMASQPGDEDWTLVSVPSIECAWNVLELWHDVVAQTGAIVEVGAIQREIVHFLERLLDRAADDPSRNVKAISSAVSSYLVLQGDVAPCEPDASTIRRAVDILQRSSVVP
jgi:hypothetical protein